MLVGVQLLSFYAVCKIVHCSYYLIVTLDPLSIDFCFASERAFLSEVFYQADLSAPQVWLLASLETEPDQQTGSTVLRSIGDHAE